MESNNRKRIEIHGFADVCMKTYDEYYLYNNMHTTDKANGVIKSQLVCVKSRITPLISITKLGYVAWTRVHYIKT